MKINLLIILILINSIKSINFNYSITAPKYALIIGLIMGLIHELIKVVKQVE